MKQGFLFLFTFSKEIPSKLEVAPLHSKKTEWTVWISTLLWVGSAHTASGYLFQKVHSWIWQPLPKWKTQPMWPWRWVMASLCANTSRLVLQRWLLSQKHVKETCKLKTCNKTCFLRHPKPWKYFARNKFCKFGESCCYDHSSPLPVESQR